MQRRQEKALKKQAREIERGKEKVPAIARMLGATAAHIKISDAIAHTRTKPWNKILKRYVIILRKTIHHEQRFKIYFLIFTVDAKSWFLNFKIQKIVSVIFLRSKSRC